MLIFSKARCFAAELQSGAFFENRRQSVEKVSYGFLDIRNDDCSSQIVATALFSAVIAA